MIQNIKKLLKIIMTSRLAMFVGLFVFLLFIGISLIPYIEIITNYSEFNNIKVERSLITNLTATSASITWTTNTKVDAEVVLSKTNDFKSGFISGFVNSTDSKNYFDDRDIEQVELGVYELKNSGQIERNTHHITLRDLEPETEYFVAIKHKGFIKEGSIKSFITDSIENQELSQPDPIYGTVYNSEGEEIIDAISIVFLESDEGNIGPISTTVNNSGAFSLDVASLKTGDDYEDSNNEKYELVFIWSEYGELMRRVDTNFDQPIGQPGRQGELLMYGRKAEEETVEANRLMSIVYAGKDAPGCGSIGVEDDEYGECCDTGLAREVRRCKANGSGVFYYKVGDCVHDAAHCTVEMDSSCNENGIRDCSMYSKDNCELGVDCGNSVCPSCTEVEGNGIPEHCSNDQFDEGLEEKFNCGGGCPYTGECAGNQSIAAENSDVCPASGCVGASETGGVGDADTGVDFISNNQAESEGSVQIEAQSPVIDGKKTRVTANNYVYNQFCVYTGNNRYENITQAPNGGTSHTGGTALNYNAIDIGMDMGTRISTNGGSCGASCSSVGYGCLMQVRNNNSIEIFAHLNYKTGEKTNICTQSGICSDVCNPNTCTTQNVCSDPRSGNTGDSYGSHLHYGVKAYVDGKLVDPCDSYPGGCIRCVNGCDFCKPLEAPVPVIQNKLEGGISLTSRAQVVDYEEIDFSKDFENGVPDGTKDGQILLTEEFKMKIEDRESIDSGVYLVTTDGRDREVTISDDDTPVVYFEDLNGNNVRDDGERLLSPVETEDLVLEVNKIAEATGYYLSEGWNLISLPSIMEDEDTSQVRKASELIKNFNDQGAKVTHVTTFRSGAFVIYSVRENNAGSLIQFGEDFNIIPGEGYFIKNYDPANITLKGKTIKGGLELLLHPGWNLVGVYNEDIKSYKSFDILEQMNASNIPATVLSKWGNGQHENVILKDDIGYGFEFELFRREGYWVRVDGNEQDKFIPK